MYDRHHILHYAQEWSLRPEAKYLREHPALIPKMEREDHNELHRVCPPVPLLGHYALARTIRLWTPAETTVQSVDNLLRAMEGANKSPKAHPIERELGYLTMEAIEMQRPFFLSYDDA